MVAKMHAARWYKSQIKAEIRSWFAEGTAPSYRTIEDLITAGRTEMLAHAKKTSAVQEIDAVAFAQSVIADPRASYRDKLVANQQLIDIAGAAAKDKLEKMKFEQMGGAGNEDANEKARKMIDAMAAMDQQTE
jgi:2,4-dienoyl-CoA reductase-like NADH-dependent reductase (Old Yellow Enzyme family)